MRLRKLGWVAILVLIVAVSCAKSADTVRKVTSLDEAQTAAKGGDFIVAEFYSPT